MCNSNGKMQISDMIIFDILFYNVLLVLVDVNSMEICSSTLTHFFPFLIILSFFSSHLSCALLCWSCIWIGDCWNKRNCLKIYHIICIFWVCWITCGIQMCHICVKYAYMNVYMYMQWRSHLEPWWYSVLGEDLNLFTPSFKGLSAYHWARLRKCVFFLPPLK